MKKSVYSKLKKPLYLIFLSVCFLSFFLFVTVYYLKNKDRIIYTVKAKYIVVSLLLTVLYFILNPLSLCRLFKKSQNKISGKKVFLIAETEHFFNGITPFSMGGQPYMAYAFSVYGLKLSEITGLFITNSLISFFASGCFAGFSLLFYNRFTVNNGLSLIAVFGYIINFSVPIFTSIICFSDKIRRLLLRFVLLITKIRFLKSRSEKIVKRFDGYSLRVRLSVKKLLKNKRLFITCFILKSVALFVFYSISYFVAKAFDVDLGANDVILIISATSFSVTVSVFMPTPGCSGGIEFALSAVFISLGISMEKSIGITVVWRLLTFYFIMLLSFICHIIFNIQKKRFNEGKNDTYYLLRK